MKRLFIFIGLLSVPANTIDAQKSWVINNPFDQKCFIENKGQFKLTGDNANENILYGNWVNGINYYFSRNKFFITYPVKVERTEEEIRVLTKGRDGEEKKELKYKTTYKSICFNFLNTNVNCIIRPNEKVSEYFNYNGSDEPKKIKTIIANAYKSITYQNIYPNVDLTFLFRDPSINTQDEKGLSAVSPGLKYYFEVRPGGDISKVQYSITGGDKSPILKQNGDLEISTTIGNFIDKAPEANYINTNKPVEIKYNLNKNVVSFDHENYDHTQTIIIDPWVIDPNISVLNRGFDVDYDNWGNVYVYGGDGLPSFQLKKYTSSGALIWTFNFVSTYPYYGDFAVDRKSGSVYIVEAINNGPGASVTKLNQAGSIVATFPGDANFYEMFRIVFSSCTNQAVIGGGGTSMPSYQACYMDTNLISLAPVNILGNPDCCHDICCIPVDNYGYCYPWFVTPFGLPDLNEIKKVPVSTLLPVSFTILPNSGMIEASSVSYYVNYPITAGSVPIGMNGSVTSFHNLYTYDSFRLKRWNTNTGGILASSIINSAPDSTIIFWSGIATDPCGDVYIGNKTKISQYDSTLIFKFDYACPDTIYDVQFGNNIIYASGNGFLTSITPQPLSCSSQALNIALTVNQSTCDSNASACLDINGGSPPYNIIWNTTPSSSGQCIYNLQPDTIIVTVSDGSCIPIFFSDTVIISYSLMVTDTALQNIIATNVFTPNTDNLNDNFYGFELTSPTIADDIKSEAKEYLFSVYDRWGTVVFQTTDPTIGWNGQINNVEAAEGVYFWIIDIVPQCDPKKKYTYHNNVTLFR